MTCDQRSVKAGRSGRGGKAENGKTSEREDGKAVASVVSDPKGEVGFRGAQPNLHTGTEEHEITGGREGIEIW